MPKRLVPFSPRPGIVRDLTKNSAEGYWVDGDKVRFGAGFAEKIGGWSKVSATAFVGYCRSLFAWTLLSGSNVLGIGTNLKFYTETGGTITDITPIRKTTNPLAGNPIASTSGSGVVTITDTAHGCAVGDYVTISGATAFNDLTTGQLNQEFVVATVPTANTFTVDTGGTANASSSGGGASVVANYQLSVGAASFVFGAGWGAGAYSRGTWGSASVTTTVSAALRLWSQDNFGEDLLFAPRYGGIYRYDGGSGGRGALISSEGGASNVPASVIEILVSPNERIVFAFGCPPVGSSTMDPLLVRWTDYEDYLEWTPGTTNASGGVRLSAGSACVTSMKTRQEILCWTDTALYGFSFVGGTDIYQNYMIDGNIDIIAPLAKAQWQGRVVWMGKNGFYMYDGRVYQIECPLEDYIFRNMNRDHTFKIHAGTNALFGEIWWFYPSTNATEPDRYVVFNMTDNIWYDGSLPRTAWFDRGLSSYPRAAGADGYLYYHEYGFDDGSTTPASAILSYVESAPLEIGGDDLGKGDRFIFCDRLVPDLTFRGSTAASPALTYTFKKRNWPGATYVDEDSSVAQTGTVDEYTNRVDLRMRARAIALRVENEQTGVDWRLGTQRFRVRTDGER